MTPVSLDQISIHDQRFCISYPLDDPVLLSSVSRVGIIQPVILFDASPFLVVSGFKRLGTALKLGLGAIPALPTSLTEEQALLYAIHSNIGRGLNLVEKAHAIDRMLHIGFASDQIYDTMKLLGLQPHEKILGQLLAIAAAEEPLKRFITSRTLSMKSSAYLLRFGAEERAFIIELLSAFPMTESMIRETLELLALLRVKSGVIPFGKLAAASDAYHLRRLLKEETHPQLSRLHKELQDIKVEAALPREIDIKVDAFFEKEYIDINIRAKNEEDVSEAVEKLRKLTRNGHMRSIFELTKGHVR